VPLVLAGVVTLEICVLIGLPMNFANIIALPLLLGIGVAFKIYYVTAWRNGQTDLLQSPLTRAIFYSALTTATAFGSLWLSSHPGTSSMGKLLALSLVTTLAAAVLFQPALMGRPRDHWRGRWIGSRQQADFGGRRFARPALAPAFRVAVASLLGVPIGAGGNGDAPPFLAAGVCLCPGAGGAFRHHGPFHGSKSGRRRRIIATQPSTRSELGVLSCMFASYVLPLVAS
jgi:hypothetical protein